MTSSNYAAGVSSVGSVGTESSLQAKYGLLTSRFPSQLRCT